MEVVASSTTLQIKLFGAEAVRADLVAAEAEMLPARECSALEEADGDPASDAEADFD